MLSHRVVRTTLLLLAVIALAVVGYELWQLQIQIDAERRAAHQLDRLASDQIAAATELRAAQGAYVAAGQGDQFWMGKVVALSQAGTERLKTLRQRAQTPEGAAALEAATELLADFAEMDKRAREYVRGGQRLSASDLIFGDGLDLTNRIAARVDDAREQETRGYETRLADRRRLQTIFLAAAGGAALLVLVLLTPIPGATVPPSTVSSGRGASAEAASDLARLSVPPPATALPGAHGSASAGDLMDDAGSLMRRTPDLAATAQLCADLARVEETRELPGLLARAASVLEASGIIIWMAEGARSELRPVLAHGYSPQALGKMGTLPRDSETATAAAYRAGQLRTVASDTFSNGAIVVPLVTSAGCIGVMAAEVRNGAEAEPAERALATIVAAQLATLITPAPTENAVQAQG